MNNRIKNIVGNKYGRFTVLEFSHKDTTKHRTNRIYWKCECECGTIKVVSGKALKDGKIKSCGCLVKENIWIGQATTKHSMTGTKLYKSWQKMKERCLRKNYHEFHYYGGRGIKVCDEWLEFIPFMEWALNNGYEEGLSIDRIDPNENYEPSNCRWATIEQQQNNKRSNVKLTYNGKTQTISEWSEELGIERELIYLRYRRNYPIEKILSSKKLNNCSSELNFSHNGETKSLEEWCKFYGVSRELARERWRKGKTFEQIFYKGNLRYANTEIT